MDYRNSNMVKNAKIILRNDTSLNWASEEDNILLQRGEPAIEFDENNIAKLKIGDGQRTWNELPYLITESGNTEGGGEVVIPDNIQEQMNALTELVNSFDTRIQNAESSANAAVLASEEIRGIVDQLLADVAASSMPLVKTQLTWGYSFSPSTFSSTPP
jgi:hypothetical protein